MRQHGSCFSGRGRLGPREDVGGGGLGAAEEGDGLVVAEEGCARLSPPSVRARHAPVTLDTSIVNILMAAP